MSPEKEAVSRKFSSSQTCRSINWKKCWNGIVPEMLSVKGKITGLVETFSDVWFRLTYLGPCFAGKTLRKDGATGNLSIVR